MYNNTENITSINNTTQVVAYVFVKNNGPITGIFDNTGTLPLWNIVVNCNLPLPLPITLHNYIVNEPAIKLIAVPLIV